MDEEGVMKRDREKGKGGGEVEKMQSGECGLLETASRLQQSTLMLCRRRKCRLLLAVLKRFVKI